jgi:hypothetical protein
VHAPELELSVTLPGVVELVAICDLGEERAWVFGQRVEEDSVDDNSDALNMLVWRFSISCREFHLHRRQLLLPTTPGRPTSVMY